MTRSNTDRIKRLEKQLRILRDSLIAIQYQQPRLETFSTKVVNELKRRIFDLERAMRVPLNAPQQETTMSYSFSVKAPNKESAVDQAYFELNKVADAQNAHRFDVRAAQTAVAAFINTLGDDDSMDVAVSMSGTVSVQGRQGEPQSVTSVGTSISVSHASRPLKV